MSSLIVTAKDFTSTAQGISEALVPTASVIAVDCFLRLDTEMYDRGVRFGYVRRSFLP